MTVNEQEFNNEMQQQKQRARNAAAVEATDWVELRDGTTEFVGYDMTQCDTEILRYRKVKQKNNEFYQIVLARTPFYAEMGGQVGDKGTLTVGDETIEVIDTKRENNLPVHIVKKMPTDPTAPVLASIDTAKRRAIECNHTATHLIHTALRQVLGTHVEQKGSYVDEKILRFDFSHFKKVTPEEIRQVEHLANDMVRHATVREEHRELPIDQAKSMGAMALFGEKYGDRVRVIKYEDSVELCGGTHVPNTGNIGMIKIINESSIAAGIRRIEAITGEYVENTLDHLQDVLLQVKSLLNNAPDALVALRKSLEENASLRKQAEGFIQERINTLREQLIKNARVNDNGVSVMRLYGPMLTEVVKGVANALRGSGLTRHALVAATFDNDRPMLTIMLTDDLVKEGKNAGQMVREAAQLIQGGGGGQPGFAQAGGKNLDGLSAALDKLMALL